MSMEFASVIINGMEDKAARSSFFYLSCLHSFALVNRTAARAFRLFFKPDRQ